jgi:hypothetical protein
MQETAFTKARSNGALADAVEIRGGSITRVFARAELPLSLIDQPELLVPLRDQVHLLEGKSATTRFRRGWRRRPAYPAWACTETVCYRRPASKPPLHGRA